MSIHNLSEGYKNLKEAAKCFDEDVTGAKNPVKNFVIAKKAEANPENKGKVGILKKALKKISGK